MTTNTLYLLDTLVMKRFCIIYFFFLISNYIILYDNNIQNIILYVDDEQKILQ